MTSGALPAPTPVVYPETEAFWAATEREQLLLPTCDTCRCVFWYPRGICPECGATDLTWVEASGTGIVYSFTRARRGAGAYKGLPVYVLAYVELDEGVRVMTNIVGCDPDDVSIGQRVEVVFDRTSAGCALYRFRPIDQEG